MSTTQSPTRRLRLTRENRLRQLLDVAWRIIRDEGTDTLTLGHLAERAGVTKPVVYDHFGTRNGLLIALYEEFDRRQTAAMDAALAGSGATLAETAGVIASCYVDCVLAQGREIPDVLAALAGSPELEATKRAYLAAFMEKCRTALAPFAEGLEIGAASLWAMLGAAEALSKAAATGDVSIEDAKDELYRTIVALIQRVGN
ncbi:TetR/AcrR family transcriptional regulator [Magnetospirillum fulvum]|uniref:Transcriptional regulator, TetR family n=1 Tax=Magnetospirillum fulvum TaxID=1082 RepID=A0A1H6JBF1_MAGFU|nr:TetR/AcrR family transcriptional regulator [Magnetospirillum fulvum]SEH56149.1 transcriptional regulator, TetR family [Magnetospirillum fulvum]